MQVVAEAEVPAAVSVVVEPDSTDDWEMMEQNADYMEAQILTQVRAHISAVLALYMTIRRAKSEPSKLLGTREREQIALNMWSWTRSWLETGDLAPLLSSQAYAL